MAKVTVDLDYAAIGELMRTPEMEAEMVRRGLRVLENAIATAPVAKEGDDWDGAGDGHRGRYKGSFHLTHGPVGMPGATVLGDRAWCMVENDAPEALYVEYGSRGKEPWHILLGALLSGARD